MLLCLELLLPSLARLPFLSERSPHGFHALGSLLLTYLGPNSLFLALLLGSQVVSCLGILLASIPCC